MSNAETIQYRKMGECRLCRCSVNGNLKLHIMTIRNTAVVRRGVGRGPRGLVQPDVRAPCSDRDSCRAGPGPFVEPAHLAYRPA